MLAGLGGVGGFFTGAAGAGVLPTSITSLEAWYDADSLSGSDGSALVTWPDSTGHGWTATRVTNGPTVEHNELNSKKIVRSTSVANGAMTMSSSLMSGATSGCFFAVYKVDADPSTGTTNGALVDRFTNQNTASHHPYSDGVIYEHFGTSARKTVGNPTPSLSSTYRIYSAHSGPSDYRAYLDGTSIFSTASNTVNFGAQTRGLLHYIDASLPRPLVGNLAELLIFKNDVLTTTDRQRIEGYLAHRWGLTANLPGGHPYKTTPPT